MTIECSLMGRCGLSPECVENGCKGTCVKLGAGNPTTGNPTTGNPTTGGIWYKVNACTG